MPGPVGKGGVLVGGAALYIVNSSPKAKQDAAWQYIKFLVDPEQQATWGANTGYVPFRESATELPAIQELWSTKPYYKVAYDQLVTGVNNAATAGPVIGPYQADPRRSDRRAHRHAHAGEVGEERGEERGCQGQRRARGLQLPGRC